MILNQEVRIKTQEKVHEHRWDEGVILIPAGCETDGVILYTCLDCDRERQETIPATGHKIVTDPAVAVTCTKAGLTAGNHCSVCGVVLVRQTEIPAAGHRYNAGVITKRATCTESGIKTYTCNVCRGIMTETIPASGHRFGQWITTEKATVFVPAKQTRTCSGCGQKEIRNYGSKLEPTVKVNASKIPLKVRQSTRKIKVTGLASGDSVRFWKSSNTKIVKVFGKSNGTCRLVAQKKTGSATVTVTLASGKTAKIKVKVQKGTVRTTKIGGLKSKLTLEKGKKLILSPVIAPITSQEKVAYSSSAKNIATVNRKGVITAKSEGKAKITVKSGKKKFTVTLKVPKTKTAGLKIFPQS